MQSTIGTGPGGDAKEDWGCRALHRSRLGGRAQASASNSGGARHSSRARGASARCSSRGPRQEPDGRGEAKETEARSGRACKHVLSVFGLYSVSWVGWSVLVAWRAVNGLLIWTRLQQHQRQPQREDRRHDDHGDMCAQNSGDLMALRVFRRHDRHSPTPGRAARPLGAPIPPQERAHENDDRK